MVVEFLKNIQNTQSITGCVVSTTLFRVKLFSVDMNNMKQPTGILQQQYEMSGRHGTKWLQLD